MANSLPGRARSETSVRRSSASGRARTDAPVRLTERPPAAGCEPPLDAADLSRVRRPPPRPRSRFRKQEPQQAARSRQAARFPRPFDTSQAPNLVLAQNEFGMPLRKDQPRRHISIPQRRSAANPFALGLIFHDGSDEIDAACRAVSLKKDICFFRFKRGLRNDASVAPRRAAMVGNPIAIGYLGAIWPLVVPNSAVSRSRVRNIYLLYLFEGQTA